MNIESQKLLFLGWLIALFALIATLYSSLVLNYPVCHLCWYQRIAMYPLAVILGIGAYNNDKSCIRYAIAFPVFGFLFALYQYLEQMIPGFALINFCGPTISCSEIHIKFLGFITIPFLSMAANLIIFILLWKANKT